MWQVAVNARARVLVQAVNTGGAVGAQVADAVVGVHCKQSAHVMHTFRRQTNERVAVCIVTYVP